MVTKISIFRVIIDRKGQILTISIKKVSKTSIMITYTPFIDIFMCQVLFFVSLTLMMILVDYFLWELYGIKSQIIERIRFDN